MHPQLLMRASSILDQSNDQYIKGHQTSNYMKDNTCHITLCATASDFYFDSSLDAGLRDRRKYLLKRSGHQGLNYHSRPSRISFWAALPNT